MGQGVSCLSCGASTPLPDDLRVPTFTCAYCQATLQTASYAGASAVSADALVGHMQRAMASPETAVASMKDAPRFAGGDTNTRTMACRRCGGALAVSLDVEVPTVTCPACHDTAPVRVYIPDQERFELDMARQVAGNEAYKRLLAEGVKCGRCGGHNRVADDGSVQQVCTFCGAAILLAEHVDASAIARHRLKHGVFALRDAAIAAQAAQQQKVNRVVGVVVAVVVVAVLAINLLGGR